MSGNNEREGCIKFTFDLGAIVAAIIALVGGILLGTLGIKEFGGSGVANPVQIVANAPQPTYTVLPTYTPYPTFTPARTIVAPKPITVVPTISTDQQNPRSGSIVLVGQSYSRNNITVTVNKSLITSSSSFGIYVSIENQGSQQMPVLYKFSFFHIRDDKGKMYRPSYPDEADIDRQYTMSVGGKLTLHSDPCSHCYNVIDTFAGAIDPTAKYLIVTIDQLVGMSNMNWRYDLQ